MLAEYMNTLLQSLQQALKDVVVQQLSCVQLFATLWIATLQVSLSFIISWNLAQIHVPSVGDAIQPSHPLLPPSPPALTLSQHQGLFQ